MRKTKKADGKSNDVMTVLRLSQRLMRGSRGKLYFLLAVITLFNIEVPLMMPFILKNSFQAVSENDMTALLGTAAGGACVFAFNFALMYFLNVYGDAWVTKFVFHAAENSFRELSGLPVSSLQAVYNDDDLFNRIAAGTGNIMEFYFALAHLLGNGVAVVVLMVMLCGFSKIPGSFILLFVAAELLLVRLQFRYNTSYTCRLQEDKAESIRRIRSLLEQLSFHQHHQTWDWMRTLYGEARQQWFKTQEKRTLTNVFLDSCRISMDGLFKTGLVYSFMIQTKLFSTYVDDVVSSFSTFNQLVEKTKGFGNNISSLPGSLVPIRKLDDVLTHKPRHTKEGEPDCLALEHLSVVIGGREIVKDASCRIPLGSKVAVIGENGSGKSTLLKAIVGLYQCRDGSVYDSGRRIAYIPADELLFDGHSVLDNISYSRENISANAVKSQLEELAFYNMEELCGKIPAQLSGGEAKRVNVARGLLSDAEIILADEPTSCLDKEASTCVTEQLLALKDRTVLYITHNPEHAWMADMVIFIQDGEIRQIIKGTECADNVYFQSWSKSGPIV